MKVINLRFTDYDSSYDPKKQLIYRLLSEDFEINMEGKPDFIISCGLGFDHVKYHDCVKILWTGENCVPNFNWFDYAIGFDYLSFNDRYLRVPLYAFYMQDMERVARRCCRLDSEMAQRCLNRGFCSFVVSNGDGDPMRRLFFEKLSQYKRVDSGGRYLNNVGGPVRDKFEFCSKYKFNIAFENSSSPGYVTEKILQAYAADTVPIYYGDPSVERDFSLSSMVRVIDDADIDRAVAEIIRLDQDDSAYMDVLSQRSFAYDDPNLYNNRLKAFFCNIFSQDIQAARRRVRYGYQSIQAHRLAPILYSYQRVKAIASYGARFFR